MQLPHVESLMEELYSGIRTSKVTSSYFAFFFISLWPFYHIIMCAFSEAIVPLISLCLTKSKC